jgi:hypothetical protein
MIHLQKILLILVIVLCFYILYKLVLEREKIMKEFNQSPTPNTNTEGFESLPSMKESKNVGLPLKEYVIMSSWNSAVDAAQLVSLDALEKTLIRGYRFIDLEIYLVNDQPHVGFSTLKNYNTMESPPVLLFDALGTIMAKAFTLENGKDPLFLHFRIKSIREDIFPKLANIIQIQLGKRLHHGKVSKNTLLSEIQDKVILVVDKSYVPQLDQYECKDNCTEDFLQMVNMYSGTVDLPSMKVYQKLEQPSQPLQLSENQRTNAKTLQMVSHGVGEFYNKKNFPDFYRLVKNYSTQIVPIKVYARDEPSSIYEAFFKNNGSRAFVPMSIAYSYIELETEN